jgi:hypothetical protein
MEDSSGKYFVWVTCDGGLVVSPRASLTIRLRIQFAQSLADVTRDSVPHSLVRLSRLWAFFLPERCVDGEAPTRCQ